MKTKFENIKKIYQTRDVNDVEALVDLLYQDTKRPILVGTSNAEIYFDREQIIRLFKNDLESWGDVFVDLDSLKSAIYGPYEVTRVSASVKQTFDVNDQTYERFVQIVKDIKNDTQGNLFQKAALIQQLLVHLMHDRAPGKREYLWDLDLDMISKNNHGVIFQFSMPSHLMIPDVRLDDFDTYNKKIFDKELEMITPHANLNDHPKWIEDIQTSIKKEQDADRVVLDEKHLVIDEADDYISFVGIGYYKKTLTIEERLASLFDHMHDNEKPKDQLFKIRRDIAQHILHDAMGQTMDVHFRAIGIAKKVNNHLEIQYINVTLPFNLILEEKTDHEKMI